MLFFCVFGCGFLEKIHVSFTVLYCLFSAFLVLVLLNSWKNTILFVQTFSLGWHVDVCIVLALL